MAHETRWIRIEPDKYDSEVPESRSGVEFRVFISPYDLPEAVRGFLDDELGRFVIEFRYIGDESSREEPIDEHVTLRLGQHSNRLQAIQLDLQSLDASEVVLRLNEAINQAQHTLPPRRVPTSNYEIARSIIADKKIELTDSFAAA
jgi:hypothetical protein